VKAMRQLSRRIEQGATATAIESRAEREPNPLHCRAALRPGKAEIGAAEPAQALTPRMTARDIVTMTPIAAVEAAGG